MKWLTGFFHRHYWQDSAWNGYYHCCEQKCSCGQRRHRVLDANRLDEADEWLPGPHPGAEAMRNAGVASTKRWQDLVKEQA